MSTYDEDRESDGAWDELQRVMRFLRLLARSAAQSGQSQSAASLRAAVRALGRFEHRETKERASAAEE
jgi:hypothetical protein